MMPITYSVSKKDPRTGSRTVTATFSVTTSLEVSAEEIRTEQQEREIEKAVKTVTSLKIFHFLYGDIEKCVLDLFNEIVMSPRPSSDYVTEKINALMAVIRSKENSKSDLDQLEIPSLGHD